MASLASLHAVVHGRVQGVFFRSFVEKHASRLGLTGYVRNQTGGMVEVWAEGERSQLERLIDYLKVGPPTARVDKVETAWADYSGQYGDFEIRYW